MIMTATIQLNNLTNYVRANGKDFNEGLFRSMCIDFAELYKGLEYDTAQEFTLRVIMERVKRFTGYSFDELRGKSRKRELVDARRFFSVFALKYAPGRTQKEIGKYIRRDHSTVINHRDTHKGLIVSNERYRLRWEEFEKYALGVKNSE